jgi:8-oxo-dGTP pyrophosphatase MutT (NUDIX family)
MRLDSDLIQTAVQRIQIRTIDDLSLAQAAVLIPLMQRPEGLSLLLTKRTHNVRYHKGQISFPGGARHGAESLERTALRETFEEICIEPEQVRLIGRFHEYASSSNFRVTPFVALVGPDARPRVCSQEVDYLLEIPLQFFFEQAPETRVMERRGRSGAVYFYDHDGEVIWGLTARMIKEFVDALRQAEELTG